MPSRKYPLEVNGATRLELSWPSVLSYKDLRVKLDGQMIATIADPAELASGAVVALSDGAELRIQTVQSPYSPNSKDLHLELNGQPLPTAANSPQKIVRETYGLMWLIGGFGTGVGLIVLLISLGAPSFVRPIAISVFVGGLTFLVLGFFVKRLSTVALILAIVLVVLSSFFLFFALPSSLLVSLFLLFIAYALSRGFKPLQTLRQR
jgi:hypothetical protein